MTPHLPGEQICKATKADIRNIGIPPYVCDLPPGHGGSHRAHDSEGRITAIWPSRVKPARPGEQSERVDLAAQLDGYCDHADGMCFCAKSNTPWEQIERDLREAASLIDQQARQLEAVRVYAEDIETARTFLDASLGEDWEILGNVPHQAFARILVALDPERNTETDG